MTLDHSKQDEALTRYASLMEDIKVRESSALKVIAGEVDLPPALAREYCFLQIRMIIEAMALGCLVVHGDIPESQTNKFFSASSAGLIMTMLEGLHAEFYPTPIELTVQDLGFGQKQFSMEILPNNFLSKNDLGKKYSRCGEILHRGSMKKLLNASAIEKIDMDEPKHILTAIRKLLERHSMPLFNSYNRFACILSDPLAGGNTSAAFGTSGPSE